VSTLIDDYIVRYFPLLLAQENEKSFDSSTQAKQFACYRPQFLTAFQTAGGGGP